MQPYCLGRKQVLLIICLYSQFFSVAVMFSYNFMLYHCMTCGRINYSTRSRAEVVGEGGSCVRAEARAPASRRRRESWKRRRLEEGAAARV
jgi:hypothetical protein